VKEPEITAALYHKGPFVESPGEVGQEDQMELLGDLDREDRFHGAAC
jgi:hypothetical protein